MNHKYEQRTICPNGEIRTRTIDANELVEAERRTAYAGKQCER